MISLRKLAFVVTTPPYDNLTTTAINIIKAALSNSISVVGVFFYQQGVLNAARHLSLPSDEFQALSQWQLLAKQHNIALHLCSTAAEKHGLIIENSPDNKSELNLISRHFIISGLGELVELTNKADRVIQL